MACTECTFQPGAVGHDLQAHGGGLVLCAAQTCGVIVDSKDVVGRRRRRRAGVRSHRPQGQRSPLWPQWAAAWPLVPRSRTLERPTLGSVRSFSTICKRKCTNVSRTTNQRSTSTSRLCCGLSPRGKFSGTFILTVPGGCVWVTTDTVGHPMARGAGGGIPGNSIGQDRPRLHQF